MDRIYASPEFTPVDGEYWYEKAIEAGSDHALHWIEFASEWCFRAGLPVVARSGSGESRS